MIRNTHIVGPFILRWITRPVRVSRTGHVRCWRGGRPGKGHRAADDLSVRPKCSRWMRRVLKGLSVKSDQGLTERGHNAIPLEDSMMIHALVLGLTFLCMPLLAGSLIPAAARLVRSQKVGRRRA